MSKNTSTGLCDLHLLYILTFVCRSAFVANLAAFLTRPSIHDVRTMEAAVALGYTMCALPQLKAGECFF